MEAVKCLKIGDSIKNPTTGQNVTNIVSVISSSGTESKGKDSDGNNLFAIIINYFFSESAFDASAEPLNWNNLTYRFTLKMTDAELAGLTPDPKYSNQLFYDKAKDALIASGYTNVTEVMYTV